MLPGRLLEIHQGDGAIVELRIAIGNASIVARITQRSLHALALRDGQQIYALVKAISLDRHSVGFA